MRIITALVSAAALTALSADASFAHVWLGRVASDVTPRSQLVEADQKQSKLPCNSEHPPSYCKPKKGAK